MLSRSKAWAIGLLVAIGVAGFASGAATMNYVGSDAKKQPEARRDRRSCSYSRILEDELGLSPAQRDTVRAILRRHRPAMREAYDLVRPRVDSLRLLIRTEIQAVLTPEQREAYQRYIERERAERRAHRDSASEERR